MSGEMWPADLVKLWRAEAKDLREGAADSLDMTHMLDQADTVEAYADQLQSAIDALATHWEETEANEVGVASDGYDCAHDLRQSAPGGNEDE